MTSKELTLAAVKILDSKKAVDIMAIKVRELTIMTDYFIIASGTSTTQVKMLADEMDVQLVKQGRRPIRTEGYQAGTWVVVDYGDLMVHIFLAENRDFYSLERLWSDAEVLDLSDILT